MIRTLIVDDNILLCQSISDYLKSVTDFAIDVAHDGREALNKIKASKPDVLILDVVMPHIDGLGVLERLDHISPETRTILISSLPSENFISLLPQALRPLKIMGKPLNYEELLATVQGAMVKKLPAHAESALEPILLKTDKPGLERGMGYIREAILYCLDDPTPIYDLTGKLYPYLSQNHGISTKTVERSIRRAIYKIWTTADKDSLVRIFGYSPNGMKNCPTNGNFIATLLREATIHN